MNFQPENDGIDHINIYSKGQTELGRWLTNFAHSPIEIPEHGKFSSIEGYWYWLGSKDERLRSLFGYEAKKLGESLSIEEINGFEGYIQKAIDIKLKSDRERLNEFIGSFLPFDHYYVFGGVRKDAGYKWIVEHFENRRKLLKEWKSKTSSG